MKFKSTMIILCCLYTGCLTAKNGLYTGGGITRSSLTARDVVLLTSDNKAYIYNSSNNAYAPFAEIGYSTNISNQLNLGIQLKLNALKHKTTINHTNNIKMVTHIKNYHTISLIPSYDLSDKFKVYFTMGLRNTTVSTKLYYPNALDIQFTHSKIRFHYAVGAEFLTTKNLALNASAAIQTNNRIKIQATNTIGQNADVVQTTRNVTLNAGLVYYIA